MIKKTLGKSEKLKSRKQIDQLFKARKFVTEPPVRLFYQIHLNQSSVPPKEVSNSNAVIQTPVQAGFSCSKKFFKQATRRNRVKRLLREAYRKQKAPLWQLCQQYDCRLSLFWLYGHRELPTMEQTEQKVERLLELLKAKLRQQLSAKD